MRIQEEKTVMRSGWKGIVFYIALACLWSATQSAIAAPTIGATSIRPHRVLGMGATADGSIAT
ncbi:MAG: hypothetical protein NZ741_08675, partial [Armatimonadetes bacterium]|nr:hypothetical protein [Armatimonadota bacterium]